MSDKLNSFGLHLTLDLYKCNPDKLNDMLICYKALENLPEKIDMTPLMPPMVLSANSNENDGGKDPGGFSGFIMIAESHISLHSFVKRGFLTVDAYSCKNFDSDYVVKYFKDIFESEESEINLIKRGIKYPPQNIY